MSLSRLGKFPKSLPGRTLTSERGLSSMFELVVKVWQTNFIIILYGILLGPLVIHLLRLLTKHVRKMGLWGWICVRIKRPFIQRRLNRLVTIYWIEDSKLEYASPERFRELRRQRRISPSTWIVIREIAYCEKQFKRDDRWAVSAAASGCIVRAINWPNCGWKTRLQKKSSRSWLTDIHGQVSSCDLSGRSEIERVLRIVNRSRCWGDFHRRRLYKEATESGLRLEP